MEQIKLEISQIDVYDEVAKITSYIGAKNLDNESVTYEKVFTTDQDRTMLKSFRDEALNMVSNVFKDFLSQCKETEESIEYTLNMSNRFDNALTPNLQQSLFDFIVFYIVSKWLGFCNNDESVKYAGEAKAQMLSLKSFLYFRTKPTRNTSSNT